MKKTKKQKKTKKRNNEIQLIQTCAQIKLETKNKKTLKTKIRRSNKRS